jgi:endonuclease III
MINMENAIKIKELLTRFPPYSEDLGIDLTKPSGRFKWFLASILYGARISEKIASNTYKALEKAGLDSSEKIIRAGWDELVRILDSGGYVRYDFSTATKLLNIMMDLKERYGSLEDIHNQSSDVHDLERRLQEFKGIGPVTMQIFLRELRGVWNLDQEVSRKARTVAQLLDINLDEFKGEELSRIETALVKLSIRCCKKRRSPDCPMKDFCKEAGNKKEKS